MVYCVRTRLDLFGQPALPFTMLLDLRNQSEYMNIYAGVFSVETQLETPHGWRVDYGFHVHGSHKTCICFCGDG